MQNMVVYVVVTSFLRNVAFLIYADRQKRAGPRMHSDATAIYNNSKDKKEQSIEDRIYEEENEKTK